MMRTANPVLNDRTFTRLGGYAGSNTMTIQGTVIKTAIMLLLAVFSASITWRMAAQEGNAMPWALGGAFGGFVLVMVTMFKPTWAGTTAPLYALLEGLFLGAISAIFEMQYPGLVFNAICLTFGTLFSLLFAYQTGFIKATQNFRWVCLPPQEQLDGLSYPFHHEVFWFRNIHDSQFRNIWNHL
jgi:uncharacterized YccA/Bax inhibitor family protein